jgi:hypothetical protein
VNVLFLVLLFLGAAAFAIEMLGWNGSRYNLMAAGLLLWILVPLISLTDQLI